MSMSNERMDSKQKHPFAITCRKCGSNRVSVIAFEYRDLEIRCKTCGAIVDCGIYDTEEGDYS
jgi:transcription elongation factor Elf1